MIFLKKTNEKNEIYLYEIKSPAQGDEATVMSLWVMSLGVRRKKGCGVFVTAGTIMMVRVKNYGWSVEKSSKMKKQRLIGFVPVCTVHGSTRFLTGFDRTSSNGVFRIARTGYLAGSRFDRSNRPIRSESENIGLGRVKLVE